MHEQSVLFSFVDGAKDITDLINFFESKSPSPGGKIRLHVKAMSPQERRRRQRRRWDQLYCKSDVDDRVHYQVLPNARRASSKSFLRAVDIQFPG